MIAPTLPHPPTYYFHEVGATRVAFSPNGEAEMLTVKAIDSAMKSVHVQAYEFSSPAIRDAVVRAHVRGLDVQVILDKKNKVGPVSKFLNIVGKNSLMPSLLAAGVPVYLDTRALIAHSKVVIVDAAAVVTGSFNFSRSAQKANAENLLLIQDTNVAYAYETNFTWRMMQSTKIN